MQFNFDFKIDHIIRRGINGITFAYKYKILLKLQRIAKKF